MSTKYLLLGVVSLYSFLFCSSFAPTTVLAELAVPIDAVMASTCKDVAIRELVASGHKVTCFDPAGTSTEPLVCTISGRCAPLPKKTSFRESTAVFYAPLLTGAKAASLWANRTVVSIREKTEEPRNTFYLSFVRPFGSSDKNQEITTKTEPNDFLCAAQSNVPPLLREVLPFFAQNNWCPEESIDETISFSTGERGKKNNKVTITTTPATLLIRADPPVVRLEGRTFISWIAENVEEGSCTVQGPGFKHESESGRASTVTISEPTAFTLTCKDLSGVTTTKSVVVEVGA